MSLQDTLSKAIEALSKAKINHALIGGFALAAHGVVRATQDIDLLVDGEKRTAATATLLSAGFKPIQETPEVSHFGGIGQLDVLWANREPTRQMIQNAKAIQDFPLPVVGPEDFIALKIQAYKNDPKREYQDKADILALLDKNKSIDLKKVRVYADMFNEWPTIDELIKKL